MCLYCQLKVQSEKCLTCKEAAGVLKQLIKVWGWVGFISDMQNLMKIYLRSSKSQGIGVPLIMIIH